VSRIGDPEGSDPLDVGVVVVTYNSGAVIERLLATLPDGLAGVTAAVVVVDNASSDGTVGTLRAAGVEVIESGANDGYSAAINRGLRRFPTARSILVLNPDVELTPGCVATLFGALAGDERVGIVAPKTYLTVDPPVVESAQRRDATLLTGWATALLGGRIAGRLPGASEVIIDPARHERVCDVDWIAGHALLCSRRCIDAVGAWDESFFLYSEETDYCQRARDAGLLVRYLPDAVVVHPGGDGEVNPALRAMMAVNRVRLYHRRHGEVATWLYWSAAVVYEATRAIGGNVAARSAARALVSPRRRPPELKAGDRLLPR